MIFEHRVSLSFSESTTENKKLKNLSIYYQTNDLLNYSLFIINYSFFITFLQKHKILRHRF